MKAVICNKLGSVKALCVGEMEEPKIGPDKILIEVRAAGVNLPDRLIVEGKYQTQPQLPFAPGFEVAGIVKDISSKDTHFSVGDRVMALTEGNHGGFAEVALANTQRVIGMPPEMDFQTAAAFFSSYGTAYHALVQRAQLKQAETLVVLGAGGGLGLAAIEIGRIIGAQVIAIAGSENKLRAAKKHGAHYCINYKKEDVRERLLAYTQRQGADVCLDPVGGQLFQVMSRLMNWGGRLLIAGFASGNIPQLAVNLPLLKCYQLVGVFWDSYVTRFPEENRQNFAQLFFWYRNKLLNPEIYKAYPLESYASAFNEFDADNRIGRMVLTMCS